jgi:cell division septum initiation protein DivIVA
MSRASIERKLTDLTSELRVLRQELHVIDEQLQHFVDAADDARLRSLISETPLAANEHREAAKAVAGVRRDREAMMKRLTKLETKQDVLLDQLSQVRP